MFPDGPWSMPTDYWAMLYQQAQAAALDEETIKKFGTVRCNSCGKFMPRYGMHISILQLGTIHMTEACIERAVEKLRETNPDWHWGLKK